MTATRTIRPGLTLEVESAASWERMEAERGAPLDVNRSLAPRDVQMELYEDYTSGRSNVLALHPDYSWHCPPRVRAVDTDDDAWIRAHPDHGWRFVVKSEKWHAQYYPELDKHRGEHTPVPVPTIERLLMDKTLVKLISYSSPSDRNGMHLAGPGFFHTFTAEEWEYLSWQKDSEGKTLLDGVPTLTPPTDRAFDVQREFYLSLK